MIPLFKNIIYATINFQAINISFRKIFFKFQINDFEVFNFISNLNVIT
jgi:hypothetical protein